MANAESAKEVFDNICLRFQPEKAGSESAVFLFELSGAGGGTWWTVIADGTCSAGEGQPPPNDGIGTITVHSAASDFVDLVNGKLNPTMAFMQGKFKIQGNMGLALKMVSWFDLS
jgi:putative sterol carrier protein